MLLVATIEDVVLPCSIISILYIQELKEILYEYALKNVALLSVSVSNNEKGANEEHCAWLRHRSYSLEDFFFRIALVRRNETDT